MAEAKALLELMTDASDTEWSSAWCEGDLAVVDGEDDRASLAGDDLKAPPPKTSMAAWSMIGSRSPPSSILPHAERYAI